MNQSASTRITSGIFDFKSLVMNLPDDHAAIAVSINDDNDQGLASLFSALLQVVNADLHR